VRARVAAEPVKQNWWAVFAPSLRVVFCGGDAAGGYGLDWVAA